MAAVPVMAFAWNETRFYRLPQDFIDSHCQLLGSFELRVAV
jgi:hypothetical protein